MAELKIDTQQLSLIAQDIRKIEKDISENMNKIGKAINKTGNCWKTKSITAIINKYDNLAKEAADLVTSLEAYSVFMEQTTGIFEQVENAIKKVVEEVSNSNEWK